ncbi:MAG: cytochrome c oxidase subunit I [Candidatus Eisenbacteria bacterium]|nr:cytochrome c oxidase subunit I [Candidatus Latescibacterota bacterium]MBD3302243.1 cytochrome c oxidase subunit I [Candidatus Eisenbacteria bacterium]
MSSYQSNAGHAEAGANYLNHSHGLRSWFLTLDHKRIGILYLVSILTAFLLGGIFALLVRTELWTPAETIMDADTYNKLFTLHGAVMIFLFIIPGIPAALGNFVLPLMLGAKDVAFPRLNLASWYLYLIGALFSLYSIATGGVDTGWTFYTPYSTETNTSVASITLGVFILGFSSIFTGINFIVTIHKLRPRSMTWFRMPLLLWALYATAIIQVLATPVLGITVLLLFLEKTLGIGIFNPALGGDPVLYQHFFWFYSHPAVYIMILPAMGVISELFTTFSHRPIFGYRFIAYSSIAIAVISFLVWGHHMFTSTQSGLVNTIFSFLTFLVAIPSAIKVFNWLATMYKGSLTFQTPMLYALSFLFLFGIGGLTGLFLGALATDVHLHDTYFIVAHFHYVMFGGVVIAFLGGLHYWWPKIFGRMYNETWGKISALLVFIGFNVTFFNQFVMGSQGMPRRYYNYVDQYTSYHQYSTVGSYLLGFAFLIMAVYLLHSLFRGAKAESNPWGGPTLEWECASPPPHENFAETPQVGEAYDFSGIEYDPETDSYKKRRAVPSAPPPPTS